MMLLDGRVVSKKILDDLIIKLSKLDKKLGIAVVQIGDDEAINIYVRQKEKLALELGYKFRYIKFDNDVSQDRVLDIIDDLNNDDEIDGILIHLPLPDRLNKRVILNRIVYYKDIDGLTDVNVGKLVNNNKGLVSCTALGIIDLLKYYNIDIKGSNVVIVGRSDLVSKPVFNLLINNDATVTMCHSKTKNLSDITRRADILIVAVGKDRFIKKDMVKEGAVIIDVGINRVDGKVYGDVDFDEVKDVAGFITPVPGGVGPVTIAELGCNIYMAYCLKNGNAD